jgi:hypothetical protein
MSDPTKKRPAVPETRGHHLLAAWLIEHYRREGRRPGRPHFESIRAFVVDLNAQTPEGMPPIQSPIGVYDWLGGSGRPVLPGRHWRPVIERLSRGLVPAASWSEPIARADAAMEA